MSEKPIRIAVDIGGTFTDLQILVARNGAVRAWKTPTTPEDPSIGLLQGVTEAASRFGFALDEVGLLLHGTTIATNAVLERKLARGVLLTTAGFEDVLEITRHVRRELYKVDPDPFPCLIERDRRLGVPERMRADGTAEQPLDEAAILASVRKCSKVVILDEANEACAVGAQVASLIAERAWEDLDGPVVRVATPDVPIPFSPPLEQAVLPQVDDIREACRELLEY